MSDLFNVEPAPEAKRTQASQPLADRLRPQALEDLVGQDHLLDPEAPLGRMLARGQLGSIILWGPPGSGKTTLARLIARRLGQPLTALSAVMSGVADLRKVYEQAKAQSRRGESTLLFIDEIHRFNRAQQDGLLAQVEDGTVTLIGATTENPSFALTGALMSRCQVLVLKRLDEAALGAILGRAEAAQGHPLPLDQAARGRLLELADGDGRYLLNMAESLADLPPEPTLDAASLAHVLQRRMPLYDRAAEAHYNLISALHKSVRGSDPDASLYWLARMLSAGEDPRYIARRLVRMASEDIGAADPSALPLAVAASQAYEQLGSPEGELALAQCTVHLACAPKSNAVYQAFNQATRVARESGSLMPPAHILNAPTRLMKDLGYGRDYAYDHNAPEHFSGQHYFPESMERMSFYQPVGEGEEAEVKQRLEHWAGLRKTRSKV